MTEFCERYGVSRRRREHQHPGVVPIATMAPNDFWTADFKGQFRTGNGVDGFPLTIADQHTRFLRECHGLLSTETHLPTRATIPTLRARLGTTEIPVPAFHGGR